MNDTFSISDGNLTNKNEGLTTIGVIQSRRKMKFYTIHENEMHNLANYNDSAIFFNSTGSFFASFLLSTVIDGIKSNFSSFTILLGTIFFIVSLAFFYRAYKIKKTSKDVMNVIKKESCEESL